MGAFTFPRRWGHFFYLFALVFVIGVHAHAEEKGKANPAIPEPLRPWVPWVQAERTPETCPVLLGGAEPKRNCVWLSRLVLQLDEKGGTFALTAAAMAPTFVALPGDAKRWPQETKIGNTRVPITEQAASPAVWVEPGEFAISGRFFWESLPESLRIPESAGILNLTVRGLPILQPLRDGDTVWLQKKTTALEGDKLEMVVHRKVTDEVPPLLTTRITLDVAGKSREELLGKAIPSGFIPRSIESALPTRLESDGRLRIQVRPGRHIIEIISRSQGPLGSIARPAPEGPWREGEEIWVFDAKPEIRIVAVEGASAIDPQQTTLPDGWKNLPAFPVYANTTLRFVERRRGDADPPPDQLTLERELWLDFDGRGYTTHDRISGSFRRSTRLTARAPLELGRVSMKDRDQFITTVEGVGNVGVEVRQGTKLILADSRLERTPGLIPAVGYEHDFQQVSATLHLPPGFRLLHASGVDEVPSTWVRHWTLLEIFLVLVFAVSISRLYGPLWGAVAMLAFLLIFPEANAPKWSFVAVLICEALARLVPQGAFRTWFGYARNVALVPVILIAITFAVGHVRSGLYPALEREGRSRAVSDLVLNAEEAPAPADAEELEGKGGNVAPKVREAKPQKDPTSTSGSSGMLDGRVYKQSQAEVVDPNTVAQTGPGRPAWRWNEVPLRWSGPVQRDQTVRLWLIRPEGNLLLAVLRATLLALVLVRLFPWSWVRSRLVGAATFALFFFTAGPARADIPSPEVLKALGERVVEKNPCGTSCASFSRMLLSAEGQLLRLRIEVDAQYPTAVPLPGSMGQWSPDFAFLDGAPSKFLHRADGKLWMAIPKGTHQVALEGRLADKDSVQIALPVRPHRVEATLKGWALDGLHEDGLVDENLQLSRVRKAVEKGGDLPPTTLPPFVRVERTLSLGLAWQVRTRVIRQSPVGSAIVLEIPLLPGESVTTAEVRAQHGKVLLNLPPAAKEFEWTSVLEERSPLPLTASNHLAFFEVWRLDLSPIWHAEPSGIPMIHQESQEGPEWQPFPGETLKLALTRPKGIPGQTVTVEASTFNVRPGLRSTEGALELSIRSSRGAEHTVTLPAGAELESATIEGKPVPLRQDGTHVLVPLVPGKQKVSLRFRMPVAVSTLFSVPAVDLGAPHANANVHVSMSDARWILFLSGPRLGPVVLFWSLLLIVFVVAGFLGRIRMVPLRTWEWILLSIGLSQVHVVLGAMVVGWFLLVGKRGLDAGEPRDGSRALLFNLRQLFLAPYTLLFLGILVGAIYEGLLGRPDMEIVGNGSSHTELRWFADRSAGPLATPLVVSLPMLAYRGIMLAWALWIAFAVLTWLRWAFRSFGTGGYWLSSPKPPRPPYGGPPLGGHGGPPAWGHGGGPPMGGQGGPPTGGDPFTPYSGAAAIAPPASPHGAVSAAPVTSHAPHVPPKPPEPTPASQPSIEPITESSPRDVLPLSSTGESQTFVAPEGQSQIFVPIRSAPPEDDSTTGERPLVPKPRTPTLFGPFTQSDDSITVTRGEIPKEAEKPAVPKPDPPRPGDKPNK